MLSLMMQQSLEKKQHSVTSQKYYQKNHVQ